MGISGMVNSLLEHNIEAAVNAEADEAANWVTAGGIIISWGWLSIWDLQLVWVPLSESENFIVVLNLLGNQSGHSTLSILEGYSHLADVLTNLGVVRGGRYKVISSDLELSKSSSLHGVWSGIDLVLLWLNFVGSASSKSADLAGIQFVFSKGHILGFNCGASNWPAGRWVLMAWLIMEMRAIDWVRVPALAIFVLLLVILSANSLMPLVYLHNSFKSVGVLHRHTEFIVDNFSLIDSLSL